MDKVRIAIVGCGNISNLNVPGYLKHPNCEVYALCDSAPGRVEERAKHWGISPKLYTDFDQVLNDPNIDAVELLMPHHLHLPMTLAALDAGKHVSCQKPMISSPPIQQRKTSRTSRCDGKSTNPVTTSRTIMP